MKCSACGGDQYLRRTRPGKQTPTFEGWRRIMDSLSTLIIILSSVVGVIIAQVLNMRGDIKSLLRLRSTICRKR